MKTVMVLVMAASLSGCASDGGVNWQAVGAAGLMTLGAAALVVAVKQPTYGPVCWSDRWGRVWCN